ncbi:glycosyltransferase family 2 protein [Rariglobus hedericola]|uniref:Glycosyltransferase family 2 protein n=1 Tax=Rariglobus hedericola TaxID=2597822 RepID=A0A556QN92_9BACT|nr:glycosyltransferase family 2 protein [Rariglobus hedericola]TSJ78105.1 glycosyltransferase family 2 protein [Rariglobus hedericola]
MTPSSTHLVLIPSYNAGSRLLPTVEDALRRWQPVWVVIDGSTDASAQSLAPLAAREPSLRIIHRLSNGGKGAAVLTGIEAALAAGFTHALVMDSDGQHPVTHIEPFMAASQKTPAALVLGLPVFGPEVPLERLHGRKLSVGLVHFETFSKTLIGDPLFGFRVYPAAALRDALARTRAARGFDFDPEIAVRMVWAGVPTLNIPAPCRYLTKADGGVSHFHYLRDNVKMVWLHTRLITQLLLWRWPAVRRISRQTPSL